MGSYWVLDLASPVNSKASNKELELSDEIVVEPKRESWGHKAEFLLASIGMAVGLGNIWRFPYLCQKNGGGAFLIPYVIFMIIEGLPLFFIELSIGQRFRKGSIQAWNQVSPSMLGIGVSSVVAALMVSVYYIVVMSWSFYYLFISFTSNLPWEKKNCENFGSYNAILKNITALKAKRNESRYGKEIKRLELERDNFPDCCVHDTPMWYWYKQTLQISTSIEDPGIGINGPLAGCLALAWIIVYLCIIKGIKSSGKVVYFTAVFPYIVLTILFVRGVTLDGADIGVKAFFNPDFNLLKDPNVWIDAATQMFFTLTLGFGAVIAYASYMPHKNNCIRDAYTIVFVNCSTSLFAGIVVFSILGHREKKTGIPVTKVGSGPGLAFISFSDAFLLMDVSPLWAILFFFMLILLAVDSEFGILEAAIVPLYDMNLFPKIKREYLTGIIAIVLFLIGLSMVSGPGYYIFQIFDSYSFAFALLLVSIFQVVAVSWIYGNDNFANDIEYMTGSRPNPFWLICWKYLSPLALILLLVSSIAQTAKRKPSYTAYVGCLQDPFSSARPGSKTWTSSLVYPAWGQFFVAVVILLSTSPIVIWMLLDLYRRPKAWKEGFQKRLFSGYIEYLPDPSWLDPSRRKSPEEIEAEIHGIKEGQAI